MKNSDKKQVMEDSSDIEGPMQEQMKEDSSQKIIGDVNPELNRKCKEVVVYY